MPLSEPCWRCGAAMEWRHSSWQCPRCRFKLGCCEGEPQSCEEDAAAEPAPLAADGPGGLAASPRRRVGTG